MIFSLVFKTWVMWSECNPSSHSSNVAPLYLWGSRWSVLVSPLDSGIFKMLSYLWMLANCLLMRGIKVQELCFYYLVTSLYWYCYLETVVFISWYKESTYVTLFETKIFDMKFIS